MNNLPDDSVFPLALVEFEENFLIELVNGIMAILLAKTSKRRSLTAININGFFLYKLN